MNRFENTLLKLPSRKKPFFIFTLTLYTNCRRHNMGRLAALGEPMMRFRARVAATPQLIALLSSDIKDYRVKRIIGLLEQMAPHCESISLSAAEIISICEADSVRFRGFHPRLTLLKEELSTARDVLVELSQRALLYLNHIKTVRYSSPPSTHRLAQSTITEIKAMGLKLSQTAREAIDISLTRPPGPAPMPYDDNQTITTVQLEWARGLCEGELSSVGHDYDARWDPDVKMPGTQHGKFLRFPGPFFAPFKNTNGSNFYEFSLPETSGHHIDLLILKYNNIETNFKRTNRFHPRRGNKESEKFKAHQAVSSDSEKYPCYLC